MMEMEREAKMIRSYALMARRIRVMIIRRQEEKASICEMCILFKIVNKVL